MSFLTAGQLLAGFVLMVLGADVLVRGAAALAEKVGISPLVVGLTVVAFGTSAPELAVSVQGALAGKTDLALGNVVGSNVFNVLMVLGLSALVAPLVVAQQIVRVEVPVMIAVSLAVFGLSWDGSVGRVDGAILVVGFVLYTVFAIRGGREAKPEVEAEYDDAFVEKAPWLQRLPVQLGLIAAGLALLVLGSDWIVASAIEIATALGFSELVIALTIVATGTSLPELATSVVAASRGQRDIAVGNVVGSNLFNLVNVLGFTALVSPVGVPVSTGALSFDLPVMIAVAVACLPIFFTGYTISRWEGALFVGYYVAYVGYLLLRAWEHPALEGYGDAVLYFAAPLTVITLVVVGWRARVETPGGA